ncbi:MAG: hypothetical protein ACRDE2_17060 [Chitinophagaceae bacterium]
MAGINLFMLGAGGDDGEIPEMKEEIPEIKIRLSSKAARRGTMREAGIPTSQQPESQSQNASGREYTYKIIGEGNIQEYKSVQQQTRDVSHENQPHWEAGRIKADPLTNEKRMNNYGRPKLENEGKVKVFYNYSE